MQPGKPCRRLEYRVRREKKKKKKEAGCLPEVGGLQARRARSRDVQGGLEVLVEGVQEAVRKALDDEAVVS